MSSADSTQKVLTMLSEMALQESIVWQEVDMGPVAVTVGAVYGEQEAALAPLQAHCAVVF